LTEKIVIRKMLEIETGVQRLEKERFEDCGWKKGKYQVGMSRRMAMRLFPRY